MLRFLLLSCSLLFSSCKKNSVPAPQKSGVQEATASIRFATYNVSFYRSEAGGLLEDLSSKQDTQIQNVAAVIQNVNPDVLLLCEFDYDESERLLDLFQDNYLSQPWHGQQPVAYPYRMAFPSNTGVLSSVDLNNDGKVALPADAYGFGRYPGQYAFALLSKYPIDRAKILSYQQFLWSDMPNANVVKNEKGEDYYSEKARASMRLSSKNHVAVPIQVGDGQSIYAVMAHPTPPVFDGPEDRNGLRNFDEIRLLKDVVNDADYLVSDQAIRGGLPANSRFVIMGDLNADPIDGDSAPDAIGQLLNDPKINQTASLGQHIPQSKGGTANNQRPGDQADPKYDTAFFGARIDYVLPSADLKIKGSGVFWPVKGTPLFDQVKEKRASDHLLVWVDLEF